MTDTSTISHGLSGQESGEALAEACPRFVHLPGTPGYDKGRVAWNPTAIQRPAAVATPISVEEIRTLVMHAARMGFRVAPQATGHAAGVLVAQRLDDVVLIRTDGLRGVHIDLTRHLARAEAGATWEDVVSAASAHGLTALHGSAPDVGVVGYTLGGGLSWYARKHGLAVNSVIGVEVVTPSGEIVRADEDTNPDLFWAIRGGGGNFGIVTAIEMKLLPITDAYGGMMLWDLAKAPEVLRHYAAWSPSAPDEVTASFRIMRFPPIPELPDFLRGRSLVVFDAVALLPDSDAEQTLAGFRALKPEMDTFARVSAASLMRLHMDPEQPTPSVGAGIVLRDLDAAAVDAFLDAVGPDSGTSVFMAELRQLGGAVSQPVHGGGALTHLEGSHVALFIAMAPTPQLAADGTTAIDVILADLEACRAQQAFMNLAERPVDPASAFTPGAWDRLRAVRAQVDPSGTFLANHPIRR